MIHAAGQSVLQTGRPVCIMFQFVQHTPEAWTWQFNSVDRVWWTRSEDPLRQLPLRRSSWSIHICTLAGYSLYPWGGFGKDLRDRAAMNNTPPRGGKAGRVRAACPDRMRTVAAPNTRPDAAGLAGACNGGRIRSPKTEKSAPSPVPLGDP